MMNTIKFIFTFSLLLSSLKAFPTVGSHLQDGTISSSPKGFSFKKKSLYEKLETLESISTNDTRSTISLDRQERENLCSQDIMSYVDKKFFTHDKALSLSPKERWTLENSIIKSMIMDGQLNVERALKMDKLSLMHFDNSYIKDLFKHRAVTFEDICTLTLTENNAPNLESPKIREYIIKGLICFESAMSLRTMNRHLLELDGMLSFIEKGVISWQDASHLKIDSDKRQNFSIPGLASLVSHGVLTMDDVVNLSHPQRQKLQDPVIFQALEKKDLTFDEAMHLSPFGMNRKLRTQTIHSGASRSKSPFLGRHRSSSL